MFKDILYGSFYGSITYIVLCDLYRMKKMICDPYYHDEFDTPLIFNNGFVLGAFIGLTKSFLK